MALRRHFRTVAVNEYMTSQADPSVKRREPSVQARRVEAGS
jgi:hypothetical protein